MKSCRYGAAMLASLLLAASSAPAAPPPAETFFSDPDIGEALLSPSGKRLALTSAKGAKRVGLVVLDLAPGNQITRVVQSTSSDVVNVRWVNEDRLVFSLTDLGEASGSHRQAPGLFAVNADGSRMRMLVRRTSNFITTDGSNTDALRWNHRLMMIPDPRAGETNEQILLAEMGQVQGAYVESPVWLNVSTGSTRAYTAAAPSNSFHWVVDNHGDVRATLTMQKDRVQAHWLPPGKTGWVQLFDTPVLEQPFQPVGVADDGSLYVTHVPKESPYRVLTRYDSQAGAPIDPPLVRAPGFDFNGQLIQEGGVVLGVRTTADSEATVWLDERMKRFQAQVDKLLPGKLNSIGCRRCGQPDMIAVVRSYNDHDPGKLWLYQGQPAEGENRWRALGRVREAVEPAQMSGLDMQTIKARDGRELPVWVTRPDNAKGPLPAVVLVHGGPWMRGVAWEWNSWAQFLASRGYVVIEPEFRGSTGYGEAHYRAGFKQWGQAMQDDVTDALRWAQQQGLASDKACIMGASYGGYATLMGLAKDPDLYRCGVAWVAVSDLELLVQGAWWVPDDGSLARRLTLPELVGDAKQDAAMLAANSPVKLAARMKAPLLLAYGEEDQRVPLTHGKRMRDALVAAGHPPEWLTYPGEAHGFTKFDNRIDFAHRVEAFLARHLPPTAP
ncbi:alpha/beta hydrolase family protein [Roseateles cellulosilyticus]|uniref:Prolyl oligopeptidase family serine peptidase n=1 Tax=Pelomonas cellulosilytica TaxID=2906762 RepID=A0ABS8XP00_9BURK|nr:prolyl oligopeptidase family serine peptidase [Pelomonas sp. P8]MCE4553475.1 prolyl oligopeptidase family serine peptidase [Pelomonas sp. P8]